MVSYFLYYYSIHYTLHYITLHTMPDRQCPAGYRPSKKDRSHRCVLHRSRAICNKQGKQYFEDTDRCRTRCKSHWLSLKRTRGSGFVCVKPCTTTQERAVDSSRKCRRKCKSGFNRVRRASGIGTRCKKMRS
jgi:hypothetical protein